MDEPKKSKKDKNKTGKFNVLLDKIKTFYTNISSEFKKIIWPSKELLVKQTIVVIVICLLIGAVIFGMDTGLATVLQFVVGFI